MAGYRSLVTMLGVSAFAVVLAACGGGAVVSAPPSPASDAGGDYALLSASDTQHGTASACATCSWTFTQSGFTLTTQSSNSVTLSYPDGAKLAFGPFSWRLSGGGNNFTQAGAAVTIQTIAEPAGVACTFDIAGSYAPNGDGVQSEIVATYSNPSAKCSGQTGSFVLNQTCTRSASSAAAPDATRVRPDHITSPC